MLPTRQITASATSPFITTSSAPYSAFRLDRATSSTRPRNASGSDQSSSSPSPSPHQIHSPQQSSPRTSAVMNHRTTPSGSDLEAIKLVGFQKGHRRMRSKKLQAKLANNALCHGFEENVAACILIKLSRSAPPVTPHYKISKAGTQVHEK